MKHRNQIAHLVATVSKLLNREACKFLALGAADFLPGSHTSRDQIKQTFESAIELTDSIIHERIAHKKPLSTASTVSHFFNILLEESSWNWDDMGTLCGVPVLSQWVYERKQRHKKEGIQGKSSWHEELHLQIAAIWADGLLLTMQTTNKNAGLGPRPSRLSCLVQQSVGRLGCGLSSTLEAWEIP